MIVTIRFYEELNDFLKYLPKKQDLVFESKDRRSVKDLIESMGVPHVEIDLILVNGESVGFDYIVNDGDRISVYPMFERIDIGTVSKLDKEPLREVKFVLDVHLGKLAKYLLLLGFDTDYEPYRDDPELAEISANEKRILLTRDRKLLMRKIVTHGLIVRNSDPFKQIIEILDRLDLWDFIDPLSRCLHCGGLLEPLDTESEEFEACMHKIPDAVLGWCENYVLCRACSKVYWDGSHLEHIKRTIDLIMAHRHGKDRQDYEI